MDILTSRLKIGAEKAFEIIHMSDTHLTLADERNDLRKRRLAADRSRVFPDAAAVLEMALKVKKQTGDPIIHTGDLIDFVSEANLDAAGSFVDKTDCFTAAGNHEFSLYVGEAKEDAAYRSISLERVQAAFANNIRFSSRIINGVNFVAVDNSYYLFERCQLDALKAEVSGGLPVVLCVHTPLYEEKLYSFLMNGKAPDAPPYLMAAPEEILQKCSRERYEQQLPDEVTLEAYDYIVNESGIKAVLTGHVHRSFEFDLCGKPQIGVGCTDIRLITIE